MPVATAPREYKLLLKRQEKVEAELDILKQIVLFDEEKLIKPSVLKRWERISHDIDQGKGRVFDSVAEMRSWLKNIRRG